MCPRLSLSAGTPGEKIPWVNTNGSEWVRHCSLGDSLSVVRHNASQITTDALQNSEFVWRLNIPTWPRWQNTLFPKMLSNIFRRDTIANYISFRVKWQNNEFVHSALSLSTKGFRFNAVVWHRAFPCASRPCVLFPSNPYAMGTSPVSPIFQPFEPHYVTSTIPVSCRPSLALHINLGTCTGAPIPPRSIAPFSNDTWIIPSHKPRRVISSISCLTYLAVDLQIAGDGSRGDTGVCIYSWQTFRVEGVNKFRSQQTLPAKEERRSLRWISQWERYNTNCGGDAGDEWVMLVIVKMGCVDSGWAAWTCRRRKCEGDELAFSW